jgi:hypothetical protein
LRHISRSHPLTLSLSRRGCSVSARDTIHRLIDELLELESPIAERFLHYLGATADPVLRALLEAVLDDEFETGDDRRTVQEAREELARGEVRTLEEVRRELGR